MTEAEWLQSTDLDLKLAFLAENTCDRKLRLFAAACCRTVWYLPGNEKCRSSVAVSEAFADGMATLSDLEIASAALRRSIPFLGLFEPRRAASFYAAQFTATPDMRHVARVGHDVNVLAVQEGAAERLLRLLHDIIGPLPFRRVVLNSSWRTETVISVSQAIYAERAFDRLPILADALEEAGCDNAELLGHCRSGGEHVRGCWVVDLVLGRE